MKKHLFKARLVSFAVLCGVALAFASCANDDVAQNPSKPKEESNKNLTAFVVGDTTKTRTSLEYGSGDFYWEAGDYIYVRDDDGVIQKSRNAPKDRKTVSFKYMVPGKFSDHETYKVYYLGSNSDGNSVTIPTTQRQTIPGHTGLLGTSGDYGTVTAKKITGKHQFEFKLEHLPAYLVFQSYMSNTAMKSCYLTKIEVNSDNDIAETYTINPTTGDLEASAGTGSKQIVLTTSNPNARSPYGKGFSITSTASVSTNGSYMVIKPGTHTLTVNYWVKDVESNVEGVITKTYPATEYASNSFYDMITDLNVNDYDGDHYYMWDAIEQYWKGYEWNMDYAVGVRQPSLLKQDRGYYATQDDYVHRWYHEGALKPFNATESCASAPNVNEMTWYAAKGDIRWDSDLLWSTMGHLYKGGIWLKKKANIDGYNKETAFDGTDWRINAKSNKWRISKTPLSAADTGNYFFLPALGQYFEGTLANIGSYVQFWSSNAMPGNNIYAYSLYVDKNGASVNNNYHRKYGFRVQSFE